ncbi:PAS domain S-box protein [Paucibacter soli]|uniref:PAS domain S-box protein n=1 Tax=Paucibacter soli TaxID=3133433 RepID=UPI0030ABC901
MMGEGDRGVHVAFGAWLRSLRFVDASRASVLALLVLITCVVLSAWGALWVDEQNWRDAKQRFDRHAQRVELELERRLALPVYGLHGARGVFAASQSVTRDEFRAYVASRDLPKEFPGIHGFGFVQRVARSDLVMFETEVRREAGMPFAVRTSGTAEDMFVIKYIEPLASNMAAWGLDLGSEPVRREAVERAMRGGQNALTGSITLLQDELRRPGFLLLVPIYRRGADPIRPEQRERALIGFVYAPIIAAELFAGLPEAAEQMLAVRIYEGGRAAAEHLLFDSAPELADRPSKLSVDRTLAFGGRELLLSLRPSAQFERSLHGAAPWWVLGGGSLLGALLALTVWLLAVGRRRAESLARQLNQDLQRLAMVAERTTNAVICTDRQLRITWVNEGFTRMTGYSAQEAQGRSPNELFSHPGSDAEVQRAFAEAGRAGLGCHREVCNRRKDGSLFWVDVDIQPVRDEQGELSGFIEIALDISERKAQELRLAAAMRESESLLDTIRRHAIVSITDAAGVIISANEAFCRISQYSEAELLGRKHSIVKSDVQPPVFWETVWRVISSGASWRGQICNRAKDGSLYWVDSIIAPILGADGTIDRYVSIRHDITASRMAARELQRERERLSNIIEGTNAATWEWNLQTGEVVLNERWAEMIGYRLEELQPISLDTWRSHVHPLDLRESSQIAKRHLEGELPAYEAELRLKHRDGHWVWVLSRGKLSSHTEDGKPLWISGTHLDITARKLAEESLRKSKSLLSRAERLAGVGGWELDIESQELTWSAGCWRLFDLEPGSITLEQSLSYFAERDQQQLKDAMYLAIHEGQSWDIELDLTTALGRFVWLRAVGEVVRDADGKAVRLVGAFDDVTARRELEARTRRNNSVLRSVLENLPCALSVFDGDLVLVAHNQQFRDLLGFPDQLFEGAQTHFEDIIRFNAQRGEYGEHENLDPIIDAIVERARHPEAHQLERTRPNGITLEVRGSPMPDGGFVTTYVDITERKRLESDRQRSNELLRVVLDNLPCGLTVIDAQMQVVLHNAMYTRLYELESEPALCGLERFGVDELTRYRWRAGDYGQIGESEAVEMARMRVREALQRPHFWERVRPDGRCMEVRSAPVSGLGFVSTYTDVSEQRRAAQELARTVALLNAVLDSTTKVAIVATGLDRKITVFNRGAEQMLGYKAEEAVGKLSSAAFIPQEGLRALGERVSRETGESLSGFAALVHPSQLNCELESSYVRKDGQQFQVMRVVTELRGRDGARYGYLGVFIDITRQKEYEASLQEARIAAEQASVAKSQFLANMSHEIRTPMNAILGMLKLLQKTGLDARQRDYAGKTEGAARSLLSLLNDILDFSKAEAGKMTLDPHPFRPDHLLRDLAVILAANVGAKPLNLLFELDPELPELVQGDALRLQQVLNNLGGNAIKFTPRGEVRVSVRCLRRESQLQELEFAVRDTGIGIAPEHQTSIFAGFTQAEASTTRRFGGTGLGLAISRSLVELMGGELKLESAPGLGSRFYFSVSLPVLAEARHGGRADAHGQPISADMLNQLVDELSGGDVEAVAEPTQTGPRLQGLRLLVVEDNVNNQQVAQELLEDEGAQVCLAEHGKQALELLQAEPRGYDAVLMDVQMPVMDGYTATRLIRQQLGLAELPILAMTANAMASDREACLAAGMNAHVGKPFDMQELVDWLCKLTGHKPVRTAMTPPPAGAILIDDALQAQAQAQGLDLRDALGRLMGKTELLLRMSRTFLQQSLALAAELRAAPDAMAVAQALHSFKGLAATLGATRLATLGAQGEQLAKQGQLPEAAWLDALHQQIEADARALLAHAEALQARSQPAGAAQSDAEPEPGDAGPPVAGLDGLIRLLRASDLAALDACSQWRAELPAAWRRAHAEALERLDEAMANLDFVAALAVCETWRALAGEHSS